MLERSRLDDGQIKAVWLWCSEAYLRHGRKLNFPKGTDPSKTYQWRYVVAIAKKFDEWGFDEQTAQRFLDIAVRYAKQSKTMQKGLAIFFQSNILNICYEKLQAELNDNSQTLSMLRHIRGWLWRKTGSNPLLETLLKREVDDGFCNLSMWYHASRISPLFLALSRACAQSLARLNVDYPTERELLPPQTTLYLIRDEFLRGDVNNLVQAREIFANDWREPCLLP